VKEHTVGGGGTYIYVVVGHMGEGQMAEGDHVKENIGSGHRWASTSAFMSAISVGLNPLILISEEFRYRHQLPFRYRTKSISDIPISNIDKSFPNDSIKIIIILHWLRPTVTTSIWYLTTALQEFTNNKVRYWISDKTLFRYPI
jgi:hypothetical protein